LKKIKIKVGIMKAKKDIYDMDEKYITSNKKGYKIKS